MIRTRAGVVCLAAVFAIAARAASADPQPADLRTAAQSERNSGNFPAAIAHLRTLVKSGAATIDDEQMLAETLAWAKQFDEAESQYRSILQRAPARQSARLGLARVLLWRGGYAAARREFLALSGADALEGRATAAYWQGDYRTAASEFRELLRSDPSREFPRRSLADITALTRPADSIEVTATHDDQPFDAALGEVRTLSFVTPLDHWFVEAGAWRLHRPVDDRTTTAPRVVAGYERVFPWRRITLSAAAGAIRLPGAGTEPIGNVVAALRIGKSRVAVEVAQRELLTNPAEKYGTVRTTSLQWSYENGLRNAAAHLEQLSYFDDNDGILVYAYGIVPVIARGRFTSWAGASASYRDTDEGRFFPVAVSSKLDATFFDYSYRGLYLPYWTPRELREARLIAGAQLTWSDRVSLRAQVDGGEARDRGFGFGPNAGTQPLPSSIFTFEFKRSYQPFRARIEARASITPTLSFETAYEHSQSIDYGSNTFHASLVKRR